MEATFGNGSKLRNILKPFKDGPEIIQLDFSESGLSVQTDYTLGNTDFCLKTELQLGSAYFEAYQCDTQSSFQIRVSDLLKDIDGNLKQPVVVVARENEDYVELVFESNEGFATKFCVTRTNVDPASYKKKEFDSQNTVRLFSQDLKFVVPYLSKVDKKITLRTKKNDLQTFEINSKKKGVEFIVPIHSDTPGVQVEMHKLFEETFPANYLKVVTSGWKISPEVLLIFPQLDDETVMIVEYIAYATSKLEVETTGAKKPAEKKTKNDEQVGDLRFYVCKKMYDMDI